MRQKGHFNRYQLHRGLAEENVEPIPAVDPKVVENIVDRLKKRGLFDKFRKECLIDIDTTVSRLLPQAFDIVWSI